VTGRRVWTFLCVGLVVWMCADGGQAAGDAARGSNLYPAAQWGRVTPEEAGWSAETVAEAQAWSARVGSTAVMVVQHGLVVASWGSVSDKLDLHSIRKSLLNALIGIAVRGHEITLTDTLARLGIDDTPPSLTAAEKQATIADLLEARSGVYHAALYETADMAASRPPRGSHPPGTFWYYNNWDFNVLGTIYERAAGASIFNAFAVRIAAPIGMQDYTPLDGRYVTGAASDYPAYPFRMSARDVARFALLYLRHGVWRGRSIVPGGWIDASTTAYSVNERGFGYGYLWWTGPADRGVPAIGLPAGGFWAWGDLGQYALVVPSDDLILVNLSRSAPGPSTRQIGHLLWLILSAAHAPDAGTDPGSAPSAR